MTGSCLIGRVEAGKHDRHCTFGPELILDAPFDTMPGSKPDQIESAAKRGIKYVKSCMEEDEKILSTTRRATLKLFASAATVTTLPILGQNPPPESHHTSQPVTPQTASAYKYQYFRPEQLKTLDALVETIIPTDDHSPGAKAAGVSEYIDAIVADAGQSTKELWSDGLALANQMGQNSFGNAYEECSPDEQIAIMSELASDEGEQSSTHGAFFAALKRATVDGYYTSRIGIHADLEYQGNQALSAFPGCQRGEMQ